MAFLFFFGQALPAHLVGGCGARALSRKTPIYYMYLDEKQGFFRLGKEGEREGREYFYSKNCGLIQDKSDGRNMRNLSLSMADS